jgi:hypothetical protein
MSDKSNFRILSVNEAYSYPSTTINNRSEHGVCECCCDFAVNVVCNFMIGGLVNRDVL